MNAGMGFAAGFRPAASDRGWGRGAAGETSAGLKVEGANDMQRVESLAERTDRLAERKQENLYKITLCIDELVLEAWVRK